MDGHCIDTCHSCANEGDAAVALDPSIGLFSRKPPKDTRTFPGAFFNGSLEGKGLPERTPGRLWTCQMKFADGLTPCGSCPALYLDDAKKLRLELPCEKAILRFAGDLR